MEDPKIQTLLMEVERQKQEAINLADRVDRYDIKADSRFRGIEEKLDKILYNLDNRFATTQLVSGLRADIEKIDSRFWGLVVSLFLTFVTSLVSLITSVFSKLT